MKIYSILATLIVTLTSFKCFAIQENNYVLEDAERFSSLFQINPLPSPEQLQKEYIAPGTKGIEIFTPHRIKSAENLAAKISQQPNAYKKALKICLPAARNISDISVKQLAEVQQLLKQPKSAATYIVFGGNNSGGTASGEGLVLGIEVICRFAETQQQAEEEILNFVVHEIVHVYQARQPKLEKQRFSLLSQAIREGFADFIANKVTGKIAKSEQVRHQYGLEHERQLWLAFQQAMDGKDLKPWMYGKTGNEWPKDMGYWIGKRIVQSYYDKSNDKALAIQTLLKLEDPQAILAVSGYQGLNSNS
ncbi:DUF2268 domain-containing putative Zn-dependent protease [Thalassotalea marina]|uniref:DUF2268 domain-containing protein n=1 Tax=Thalassotalea marina TaxID=1673741 RepID=A0A919ELQ1_9GAMM|nr:DUF2268 domain-containing putative Zn-dependent protease [Thalassotalea marina]GHF95901.1 hypothetical protein GCM10017161_25270 [Thalassotalea marina]